MGNGWRAAPPAGGLRPAGRIAEFIEQLFPEADTTHFKGEICIRARSGQIAVLILELEVGRAFTTLPVSPLVDPQAW